MRVRVRGHIRDLLAFRSLVGKRKKRIASAPATATNTDPMNELARRLHPREQRLVIGEITDETKTTKTFKLVADPQSDTQDLAYFRAGQYLSLKVEVGGVSVTRPYSISSAPFQALGPQGFYEITVRGKADGFLTSSMWKHWKVGTKIRSSAPRGVFYHEPLRDSARIVGLAGGSGITPFRSMARAIVQGEMDAQLLLLYGSNDEDDIVFDGELCELARKAPERLRVVHVLSCENPSRRDCERGFLTVELIRKYAGGDDCSFFVCGPQVMYEFVGRQLSALGVPRRRIRCEVFGESQDVTRLAGYPKDAADRTFRLKVHVGETTVEAPARATETVLVAMERANLAPPSECRSGECGFCRTLVLNGKVYVREEGDGRRAADKRFGYIHPCASYPLSDLEVAIARSN